MGETVRRQAKMAAVATDSTAAKDTTGKVLSYDELKNLTYQYKNQVDYLQEQVKQLNYQGLVQQINYMFKVLEFSSHFPTEFVGKCSELIVTMLALPEVQEEISKETTEV